MSRRRARKSRSAPRRKRRSGAHSSLRWWPRPQTRQRWLRIFRSAPFSFQVGAGVLIVICAWFAVNILYQVVRKPTELFYPVSGALHKAPTETWREYGPVFRRHSTTVVSAALLAALAQVEGSGNPIVRTYWRWSLTPEPFDIYRPASSAVGMYQITDGTFAEARRYCIHDHRVATEGPWNDFRSCWFNSLYFRVVPSHAVEMTAAYLDVRVRDILSRHRLRNATLRQQQDLATVIHLCGAGAGSGYARRGFRFAAGQRCGDHDPNGYVNRVRRMQNLFAQMNVEE